MAEPLTFTATGSPQVVSRAIEEYARTQGNVTAIVVPWESTDTTLRMAVTAVKSDGWAIEHTNLGTIRLVDAGPERTEVAIVAEPPDQVAEREPVGRTEEDERDHREAVFALHAPADRPDAGDQPEPVGK